MWLMAKAYDWFMQGAEEACLQEWREELLAGAEGRTLEVGVGTGINLPLYPEAVSALSVVEPDRHMRAELSDRLEGAPVDGVEVVDAEAEALPFDDDQFDTAVSTLVMCSVGDPHRALAEIRRVLRPGGRLLFLEHVAAHDNPGRRKWQGRIEPVWKRLTGNCHLTRETADVIRTAGFEIDQLTRESMRQALPIVRPTIRGTAI